MPELNSSILVKWRDVWFASISEGLKAVLLTLAEFSFVCHPRLKVPYSCQPDFCLGGEHKMFIDSKTPYYCNNVNNLIRFAKETGCGMYFMGDLPYFRYSYQDFMNDILSASSVCGNNGFHTYTYYKDKEYKGVGAMVVDNDNKWRIISAHGPRDWAVELGIDIERTLDVYELVSLFSSNRLWDEEERWAPAGSPKNKEQREKTSRQVSLPYDEMFVNDLKQKLKPTDSLRGTTESVLDWKLPL